VPIRDKDGSEYKLRGPNPLIKTQIDWDRNAIKLINMRWQSEVVTDERNPIAEMRKHVRDIGDELGLTENPKPRPKTVPAKKFLEEVVAEDVKPPAPAKPKPAPVPSPPPPPPPDPDEPVQINVDPKMARILRERGVVYLCAPCVDYKHHTDDLYGDTYRTPVYGEPYAFDAVVIDQSDLEIQFWCVKPITVDSVVYRQRKEGGERHWRVAQVEDRTGGYVARGVTSETNPDFS
jgi:hypothetical protein